MTESEWEAAHDPLVLLNELYPMRGHDSTEEQTRASRLYLVACARRVAHRLPWCGRVLLSISDSLLERNPPKSEVRRKARELAEALIHSLGEPEELDDIERGLRDLDCVMEPKTDRDPEYPDPDEWRSLAHLVFLPYYGSTPNYRRVAPQHHSLIAFREVFAHPFRDARFSPEWLDHDVTNIAEGIHTSGDYSRMPILADALEATGCGNDHILEHCRGGHPHLKGCWVIDSILNPPRIPSIRR